MRRWRKRFLWLTLVSTALVISLVIGSVPNVQAGVERVSQSDSSPTLLGLDLITAGDSFFEQNEFLSALNRYQQALFIYQRQGSSLETVTTFQRIGHTYSELHEYQSAVLAYEQALAILDILHGEDIASLKADILYAAGWVAYQRSQRSLAASYWQQLIALSAAVTIPADTLGLAQYGLGVIAEDSGHFVDAIDLYTKAAANFATAALRDDQTNALVNLGNVWSRLGDYEAAARVYNRALIVNSDRSNSLPVSDIWDNLGVLQIRQGNYGAALSFYHRALSVKQSVGDPAGTSQTLNNIGNVYLEQGNLEQALTSLAEASALVPEDAVGTAINIRDTTGMVYTALADYKTAWEHYHQALRLADVGGNYRRQMIVTTINLAQLTEAIHQPLFAIALYKQAVNQIEYIRDSLRSQPLELQQRYTKTVAASYRQLAALLLNQERVFEAQQVLDLLKIQELHDYFNEDIENSPETNSDTRDVLPYLPAEQTLLNQQQTLLLQRNQETILSLDQFLNHPDVAMALTLLKRVNTDPVLQLESIQYLQHKLQNLLDISGMLYPLILDDRLELLLVPPEGMPIHHTTKLSKTTLTTQIESLRNALEDPSSAVKESASPLYEEILRPFEADLHRLKLQNLIYIPDGVLHYIPLATLYDKRTEQWLAEQYTSHNLTASDIGDLGQPPSRPLNILAGAFTDPKQKFEKLIDQTAIDFHGLTYAGQEVSFLKTYLPNTQILLDVDFSRHNLETQLQGQNVLHLATHAAFVPGRPEESFILFGNGDTITLKELRNWSLPNIDLVVLSACQTGISHIEEGLEILGMGFQVQRTRARAAMASLWWVDDRSTAQLMQYFYTELAAGATKTKALQSAQLQLMADGQDEPFYWAAFVLIGNGL